MNSSSTRGVLSHVMQIPSTFFRLPTQFMWVLAAIGIVLQPTTSLAQGETAQNRKAIEEIVVSAERRFLGADTSGSTDLPLSIEEVPQSISLLSEDLIDAADIDSVADVADYVPGAERSGRPENVTSTLTLRGLDARLLIDGLGETLGAEPDFAIFERVEVVRGPSSVVYGVAPTGGVINFVTKAAGPEHEGHVLGRVGSYNQYRIEGEYGGPITDSGSVRAFGLAAYETGNSHIDVVDHTSTTVYGRLDADVSDDISLYLRGTYLYRDRVSFDGIPAFAATGDMPPVSRSFFVGFDDARIETEGYTVAGGGSWQATDNLKLDIQGAYSYYESPLFSAYSFDLQDNGDLTLHAIPALNDMTDYAVKASSLYRFDAFDLDGSFITASFIYRNNKYNVRHWNYLFPNGSAFTAGNIFDGQARLIEIFESGHVANENFAFRENGEQDRYVLSIQSLFRVTEPLSILVGFSRGDPKSSSSFSFEGNNGGEDFDFEGTNSYRFGATYELIAGMNAYASYSESFEPQGSFAPNGDILPPIVGEQYELGLKWLPSSRLLVTAAAFEITQKNAGRFAGIVNGIDRFLPIGSVTHKGFEFQALGSIAPQWQVSAGYTWLQAEITGDTNPDLIGRRRPFIPEQTASLFTTYYPTGSLEGFGFGGGFRYAGSQTSSIDDSTTEIPSYFVADLFASYAFDDWLIQLNAENILDEHYYINTWDTLSFGNFVGRPASVQLTVQMAFR